MIRRLFVPSMLLISSVLVAAIYSSIDTPVPVGANPPAVESITQTSVEHISTECSISGAFPDSILQWCSQIQKWAGHHGLDPNLIAALILQESGGQAQVISASGAVGLMQVMPRDGIAASFYCINGPCFANRPTTEELLDPEFNLKTGTAFLSGLISRYGSPREGLRHYGPMDVGYHYADSVLGLFNRYQ